MAKTAPSKTLQDAILATIPKLYATKKALAAAAGITETTVHNIMRGDAPSASTLAKLQRAGVRIADRKLIASLDATGAKSNAA